MKICSYNLYGVVNTPEGIPEFQTRLNLLKHKITILMEMTDIFFFQEVNEHNMDMINKLFRDKPFFIYGKRYPMTTDENTLQYNLIVIKDWLLPYLINVTCLPHGNDVKYMPPEKQIRDYGMSDYRTSLFLHLKINEKTYVLGNTHTDYISIDGKINGVCKSLSYLETYRYDYALLLGDMNMVPHMAECYTILREKKQLDYCVKK